MTKLVSLAEVLVINLILVGLLLWITGDYSFRSVYWGSESFNPTTVRYPLFFTTSAVNGPTSIPGLLTLDWQQVLALLLLLTDAVYLSNFLRPRKGALQSDAQPLSE